MMRAERFAIRTFLQEQEPVVTGLVTGLALACTMALIASDDELQSDHLRSSVAVTATLFFVPAFIVTFYAARHGSKHAHKWKILRGLWPLGAAWFSLGIGWAAVSDWHATQRFDREGEVVQGEVIDTYLHDHNTLAMRYVVTGVSYQRKVSAPGRADNFVPGNPIEVYYYASDPSEGFCRKPSWQPATLLEGWALAAGIGPVLLASVAGVFRREETPLESAVR